MAERDVAIIELQLRLNQALGEIDKLGVKINENKAKVIKAQNEMNGGFANFSSRLKSQFGGIGNALSSLGITPATVGLGSLAVALKKAVDEAADAEKTFRQLNLAVEKSGSKVSAEKYKEIAGALSEITVLDDDAILGSVTNQLLKFDTLANAPIEKFKQIQKAIIDISTKEDIPLANVAESLGVALQNPAEKLSLLNRQLKIFNKDEMDAIGALAENNRLLDAQTLILSKVEGKYKGFSENFKDTFEGKKAESIRNINDALQVVGEKTLPALGNSMATISSLFKDMINDLAGIEGIVKDRSSSKFNTSEISSAAKAQRDFLEREDRKKQKPILTKNEDDFKKELAQANQYFKALDFIQKKQDSIVSPKISEKSKLDKLLDEGRQLAGKSNPKTGDGSGSAKDLQREREQILKDEEAFQKRLADIKLKNLLDSGKIDRSEIEKKIRSEEYGAIGKPANKLKALEINEIEKRIVFRVDEESVNAYSEAIGNIAKKSELAVDEIKGDSVRLSSEQINQINLVSDTAIASASTTVEALRSIMNSTADESLKIKIQEAIASLKKIGDEAKGQSQNVEDLKGAFSEAFKTDSLELQNIELLKQSINSVSSAFTDAIFEGKNFSDTLADLGKNILKTITNMLIMKGIEKGFKSIGLAEGGMVPAFAEGGYNANYSGMQIPTHAGGTGTSDSIKARLSAGEFVVNRQTVDKFGAGFFYRLQSMAKNKKSGINLKTGGHIEPPKIKNNVVHLASGGLAKSNGLINNFAVNVVNRGEPKNVTDRQVDPQTGVVTIVLDDIKNNGAISNAIAGTFGLKR